MYKDKKEDNNAHQEEINIKVIKISQILKFMRAKSIGKEVKEDKEEEEGEEGTKQRSEFNKITSLPFLDQAKGNKIFYNSKEVKGGKKEDRKEIEAVAEEEEEDLKEITRGKEKNGTKEKEIYKNKRTIMGIKKEKILEIQEMVINLIKMN
jgi:hypothetical protein